jgi:23S rRNA pseudouridine1911/1915/1917 synthase
MMHNPKLSPTNDKRILSITADEAGQRLDRYLVSVLSDISRTRIQELIADGIVLVNGRPSKPGYALRAGDQVQVPLTPQPRQPSANARPQYLPLDIIYEDEHLLVVNKAAGMVAHPAAGHQDDTLVNALLAYYPELRGVGGDQRPGIVHRLDKDTSGLMIVAKNAQSQAALIEQMKRHEIVKRYLALVEGKMALDQGTIDAPIGRDSRYRQQMAITAREGREARTYFRVLRRFQHHTLLLLQLETGRTHQIRVHLKAIGHPVVGDPVYGGHGSHKGPTLKRQFLHAYQLKFRHPATGKILELEAPLPDDLQDFLQQENIL